MKSRTWKQTKIDEKRLIEIENLIPNNLCRRAVRQFFINRNLSADNDRIKKGLKILKVELVRMWLNMLFRTHREKGEASIKLNSQLLPEVSPVVLYRKQYSTWYEILERQDFLNYCSIRQEDVRPLFNAFIKNVKKSFSGGEFILVEGFKITTDGNGYYLLN